VRPVVPAWQVTSIKHYTLKGTNVKAHCSYTDNLGCHFLIGLQPHPALTEHDQALLRALRPAGVILYRENFLRNRSYKQWLLRYKELIDQVRTAIARDKLLICIDHEGGLVTRPPDPITPFGYAQQWASKALEVGKAMGQELRSLGVNLAFGPVVDIDSNPANPVIGRRAFGSTAESVTKSAQQFIEGLESEGIIGCLKHFPGHGDTTEDSHFALPVSHLSLEELRERELLPYRKLIEHPGARVIMSAHILFPSIDATTPATASYKLLKEVLRDELGYKGAIVSDDIGMAAVNRLFETPEYSAKVINASCDVIMVCAKWCNTGRAMDIARYMADSLDRGIITADTLAWSRQRIDSLLEAVQQYEVKELDHTVFERHREVAPLIERTRITAKVGDTCTQ
jgi:beta-N-acetylhexosaminidase